MRAPTQRLRAPSRPRLFPLLPRLASVAAVVAVAALALPPREAAAFCRTTTESTLGGGCASTGLPLYWKYRCVGFRLTEAGTAEVPFDRVQETAVRAFESWSKPSCSSGTPSVDVSYLGTTKTDKVEFDVKGTKANIVVFRDNAWPYEDTLAIALTTLTYDKRQGEILDADIEVNSHAVAIVAKDSSIPLKGSEYDLSTILTHEAGHFLGLAHSEVRDATMYYKYNPGTVDQGTLKDDDAAGICAIYRSSGARTTAHGDVVPAAVCAPTASEEAPASMAGGAFAFACAAPGPSASRPWGASGLVLVAGALLRARRRNRAQRAR
mgnify:CR=1 FL=1